MIGINSQIETGGTGGGNVGIGFAVPIDTARKLLPELEKGKVSTGYLGHHDGITIDDMLAGLNLPVKSGVLVDTVQPSSPAAEAGIKGGEIPAQVDGATRPARRRHHRGGRRQGRSRRARSLTSAIADKRKGDKVKITIVRDGKKQTVAVTLAERPQAAPGTGQAP